MKKYIFASFAALLGLSLVACEEEAGKAPGSDSNPVVTVYKYEAEQPYNSDNDARIRFVANNKVSEAYYVVEKTADVKDKIANNDEAFISHVISDGKAISGLSVGKDIETMITDLYGPYTVAVVAVNGGKRTISSVDFIGLEWDDVSTGTYTFFAADVVGMESTQTTLQQCTTNKNLYRFKDLYGKGFSLKFSTLPDFEDTDADGTFQFMRVAAQSTGISFGEYGNVSVRDIGYWQGNDAFVTEYGYNGAYYLDGSYAYLFVQYYGANRVDNTNNLGYDYDEYVAD